MLEPHLLRACTALKLKQFQTARREAMEALAVDPESEVACLVLGEAHLMLDDWQEARNTAQKVIERSPNSSAAFRLLAWGWYFDASKPRGGLQSRQRKAAIAAMQALQLDPDDSLNYRVAGWVAYDQDGFEKSLELAERGLAISPLDVELLRLQAECFFALRRFAEADAVSRLALERAPEDAMTHLLLARLRFQEGEYLQARAHIADSVRLDPNFRPAQTLYWELLKTQHWLLRLVAQAQIVCERSWRRMYLWLFGLLCGSILVYFWATARHESAPGLAHIFMAAPFLFVPLAALRLLLTRLLPFISDLLWRWLGSARQLRPLTPQQRWEMYAVVAAVIGFPLYGWLSSFGSKLPSAWYWSLVGAATVQAAGSRVEWKWLRYAIYGLAVLILGRMGALQAGFLLFGPHPLEDVVRDGLLATIVSFAVIRHLGRDID